MTAPTIEDIFDIKDITAITRDTKTNSFTCSLGSIKGSDEDTTDADIWQQVGFASLPSNAGTLDAAQAISITRGSRNTIIATRDVRGQQIYGTQFGAGDTCVYACGPDTTGQPRILLKGSDGGISLYTKKANSPTGIGLGIFISAQMDEIRLLNSTGCGIIINPDGVKIITAKSSITVDAGGDIKSVATGKNQLDGATICIGNSNNDYIALSSKVDAWLKEIKSTFNSHTHTTVTGLGTPSPPLMPIVSSDPTNSANKKIAAQ